MICPKCKFEFSSTKNKIYKHGNKHIMKISCPNCKTVLKEEKSFSQTNRLLGILLALPFIFFSVLLSGIVVKQNYNINYQEMMAMILVSVLLLVIIKYFRDYLISKKEPQ